jgi:hypothetical protein
VIRALVLALALAGCKTLVGIEETSVPPDAALENKVIDTGDGRDGPIVVASEGFTDDVRAGVTANVGEGSTLIPVTTADGFAVGDEVIVIQMTGDVAGNFETGRVRSTAPGSLTLEVALATGFPADTTGASQVIHIPNFSSVTIASGGRLGAHPWDGVTGGVLFFRVRETLTVEAGGVITADLSGFGGGLSSVPTDGGLGGDGGPGGGHANCPVLGCGVTATGAGSGTVGQFVAAAEGDDGAGSQLCRAGDGGAGGTAGNPAAEPLPAEVGQGLGGGANASDPGANLTASITRPLLGGGGAGGIGGRGGVGAGGGGGGGGPVAGNNPAGVGDGTAGGVGQLGGPGGVGGNGGLGGGIVMIHAKTILLTGDISARGAAGGDGGDGEIGGIGGFGGFSGPAPACSGASIFGGRGGGGGGGEGGQGGSGGGGGAGGVIELVAEELHLTGTVRAIGGAGSVAGLGGLGGAGGPGAGGDALTGPTGPGGTAGGAGTPGHIFISFVDVCDGCATGVDPPAGLSDL